MDKNMNLKHGHTSNLSPSRTYQSWQCMTSRCRYRERDTENKYVNRGITYCSEWGVFENFLNDMGERPRGMTLDRIDNNSGYSKSNCKWSTPIEQARNRRNAKLTFDTALEIAIRMLAGESPQSLALEYGISKSLPREIHKRRTWKDAHDEARKT